MTTTACEKRTYDTWDDADRAAKAASAGHQVAYRCPSCNKYHMGTKKGVKSARNRRRRPKYTKGGPSRRKRR